MYGLVWYVTYITIKINQMQVNLPYIEQYWASGTVNWKPTDERKGWYLINKTYPRWGATFFLLEPPKAVSTKIHKGTR